MPLFIQEIVKPKERLSLSVNIEPDLITALDSYISKGEVLVNGNPPILGIKHTGSDTSVIYDLLNSPQIQVRKKLHS